MIVDAALVMTGGVALVGLSAALIKISAAIIKKNECCLN